MALYQVYEDATAWHYTFNKDTIVFDTKKEAIEKCKLHERKTKGYKYIVLNKKQKEVANLIKNGDSHFYVRINDFLRIK